MKQFQRIHSIKIEHLYSTPNCSTVSMGQLQQQRNKNAFGAHMMRVCWTGLTTCRTYSLCCIPFLGRYRARTTAQQVTRSPSKFNCIRMFITVFCNLLGPEKCSRLGGKHGIKKRTKIVRLVDVRSIGLIDVSTIRKIYRDSVTWQFT